MRFILIGNPNVGKSSLFNLITDTYAHVGNYGGITVEQKSGKFKYGELLDLPGTYSIIPNSEDEGIVTHTLINDNYEKIINIVDSTHLKRNLHLTIQLKELGKPVIIAANMIDELSASGRNINYQLLSERLKSKVIGVSAKTKQGLDILLDNLPEKEPSNSFRLYYGEIIEKAIEKISAYFKSDYKGDFLRGLAIQLLEGNKGIDSRFFNDYDKAMEIVKETEQAIIAEKIAFSLKGAIFNSRREFINSLVNDILIVETIKNKTKIRNHRIDSIITHPVLGLLIFLLVMFSIYFLTFDFLGTMISDMLDGLIAEEIVPLVRNLLNSIGLTNDNIISTLITEGVILGVGGVLVFIPQIAILFLLLAIIEGTGYMARVAIMLDTVLSKFGLNGKSIVPLVTGIGCNVPAIMATRTIADKKERLLTILIIPFMSCSARIPIYALLASLFFESHKAIVIISMYIIGTLVALISAKALSLSIFKNTTNNFVLEIPPYRFPRFKNVFRHTLLMLSDFVEKAGKFILLGSIVLWFLQYLGPNGAVTPGNENTSFLGYLGNFFAPIFYPIGFGTWEATSSLIIGFLAKELIYSSMMIIYGGEAAVGLVFTGLSAYTFMVFSLLYLPCLATVGTIYQETKSKKFVFYSLLFTFFVAYFVSLLIYRIGLLFV